MPAETMLRCLGWIHSNRGNCSVCLPCSHPGAGRTDGRPARQSQRHGHILGIGVVCYNALRPRGERKPLDQGIVLHGANPPDGSGTYPLHGKFSVHGCRNICIAAEEKAECGLHYLTVSPLWGVGPLRWRLLDLNDGGKYFNTWHIHNIPLHIGVETGLFAMGMVILAGIRALSKKKSPCQCAETAAFLFHNLMDTSFFCLRITALALTAVGKPESGERKIGSAAVKVIFALFAVLFAFSLYSAVRSA